MSRYRQPVPTVATVKETPQTIAKHPFVAKQRIKADMSDSQKGGIEVWNSLIGKLQEAGLMEDRN